MPDAATEAVPKLVAVYDDYAADTITYSQGKLLKTIGLIESIQKVGVWGRTDTWLRIRARTFQESRRVLLNPRQTVRLLFNSRQTVRLLLRKLRNGILESAIELIVQVVVCLCGFQEFNSARFNRSHRVGVEEPVFDLVYGRCLR